jgi:DNA-binding transcriptional MerR regulator
VQDDGYISMQEAASLLSVTTATLRNWDKTGRLRATRNPLNRYRMYRLKEVLALQRQTNRFPVETLIPDYPDRLTSQKPLTAAELRRLIKVLHRILRDCEGNSSLIERFDELTKILYCKVLDEQRPAQGDRASPFTVAAGESDQRVAARMHAFLNDLVLRNRALFPERFRKFRLSDATLRRMTEALSAVRIFSPNEDLKGLAYEEVIRNTFDKGDNQQFFTPRLIIEFMVQMLDWSSPAVVCDPACGTGGFLLFVDRYLRRLGGKGKASLLGFEIDERLAWAAGINLDMHGAGDFVIHHLDGAGSLGSKVRPFFQQIDVIVTNPPFGSDLSDREALADFELGRDRASRRRGVVFIERCLDLLKPGGILAIIIDDGVLNSPSNADTRKLILERSLPFAIVSLPETAFMPYASVKTSILYLQKRGGRRRPLTGARGTFFAQAEVVGRKPNGDPLYRRQKVNNRLELDSDLPEILREWAGGKSTEPARNGSSSERAFWAAIPGVDAVQFAAEGHRLDLAYHHPSRHKALQALDASPYPLKTLLDVCDVRSEAIVPSRDLQDEELTYLGLANIEAYTGVCAPAVVNGSSLKSSVKRFVAGDILFAKLRPELRKVCFIPQEVDEGYASSECLVLVPKVDKGTRDPVLLPELLAILLRSDLVFGQIVHLVIGIGRPRLGRTAILNVRLPVPPQNEQRRLLESYRRSEKASQVFMNESETAAERARQVLREARKRLVDDLLILLMPRGCG